MAPTLGVDSGSLSEKINQLEAIYQAASDRPSTIAKSKLRNLSEYLAWSAPDLCRVIAKHEAERPNSDIQPLFAGLEQAFLQWRDAS